MKRQQDWTKEEDKLLLEQATKIWKNKQDLMSHLATILPNTVTPTQAIYHVVKHLNAQFTVGMTEASRIEAIDWLSNGKDSQATQQHIQAKFGIWMTNQYYNFLRFHIKRGTYKLIKDPNDSTKMILEHRHVMFEHMGSLVGKQVMHTRTTSVSVNVPKALLAVTVSEKSKIKDLDFLAQALDLPRGTFLDHLLPGELQTTSVDVIAKRIMVESGIADTASNYFAKA